MEVFGSSMSSKATAKRHLWRHKSGMRSTRKSGRRAAYRTHKVQGELEVEHTTPWTGRSISFGSAVGGGISRRDDGRFQALWQQHHRWPWAHSEKGENHEHGADTRLELVAEYCIGTPM